MKAYWLASGVELNAEECFEHNIWIRTDVNENDIPEISASFGCQSFDSVRISDHTPNIHKLLASFQEEQLHPEDEIRIIFEGNAIFDIRSSTDEWIRVEVAKGDLIQIPAMRYHRFYATGLNQTGKPIEAIRLFKTKEGWTPLYRKDRDECNQ